MLKEENCHVADEKTEYLGGSPNDTRLLRNCFQEPGSPDSGPVFLCSLIQAGTQRLLPKNIHTPTDGFQLARDSHRILRSLFKSFDQVALGNIWLSSLPIQSALSVDCHPLPSSLLFYSRNPKGKHGKSKNPSSRCPVTLDQTETGSDVSQPIFLILIPFGNF